MRLREGKIALAGVIISTIPSSELAGKKERTRKTTTIDPSPQPHLTIPDARKRNYSVSREIIGFHSGELECANLRRAYPLRPAIQISNDVDYDCIGLADPTKGGSVHCLHSAQNTDPRFSLALHSRSTLNLSNCAQIQRRCIGLDVNVSEVPKICPRREMSILLPTALPML